MSSSPSPVALDAAQRVHLRGRAHPLAPVVRVGRAGATAAVLAAVDVALATHELVKVRMDRPDDKRALGAALAAGSHSALVGLVGHTAILYRPDPEAPRLQLPPRRARAAA